MLLFGSSLDNGFVLDDTTLIRDNPLIREISGLPVLFRSGYWEPEAKIGLYRPLVISSYALNYSLGQRDPWGYHLANVVLHAFVCLLVLALYRRLAKDPLVSAGAAFLFAALAIHTEVVANVVGRAEILWALFFLLSFLAYDSGGRAGGRFRVGLYAGSMIAYFAALLSKESAITLLGVILLHDLLQQNGGAGSPVRRARSLILDRWRAYAGFVLVTLLYLALRILALGWERATPSPPALDNPLVTLELPWRVLTALQVGFRYLWLQLFSLSLSYDYSYDQIPLLTSLGDPRSWLVSGLSAAALGFLVWSWRGRKLLFLAAGFYLVTFSPVSNLFVAIGTIMGERLVYVPSIAFCLALVLLLRELLSRIPGDPRTGRAVFVALLALIVGLHSVRTLVRIPDWRSEERLYLHDVQVVPKSAKALNNAGTVLQNLGRHREALGAFEKAAEIYPGYGMLPINRAYSLQALGRLDEAILVLEDELRREGRADPALYNNLGFLLVEEDLDVVRGVSLLEKAVAAKPGHPDFLDSLAWGYYKLGRHREAHDLLVRSLEINDWSPSTQSRRLHLRTVEQALLRRSAAEESEARSQGPSP